MGMYYSPKMLPSIRGSYLALKNCFLAPPPCIGISTNTSFSYAFASEPVVMAPPPFAENCVAFAENCMAFSTVFYRAAKGPSPLKRENCMALAENCAAFAENCMAFATVFYRAAEGPSPLERENCMAFVENCKAFAENCMAFATAFYRAAH